MCDGILAHKLGCALLVAVAVLAARIAPAQNADAAPKPRDPDGRLRFTEKDLPRSEKGPPGYSEIDDFARRRGFDYAAVARRAARGETKALQQFFAIADGVDGAAAESHAGVPTVVYHLLGDDRFAKFLRAQPIEYRVMVRNSIGADADFGSPLDYLRRHFPQTTSVLFQREVVDWPSPDGRFAIRKIFSDEFDLDASKVVRAEVIERKSGEVRGDLTATDIGTGAEREGEILWSPDSKRFAALSIDLPPGGNLFDTPRPPLQRKRTTIYQLQGDAFTAAELAINDVPGRASDAELEGAILGHEHIEPKRWQKPNVLLLQRHEYYQKLKPMKVGDQTFDTVHSFDRLYQITATLRDDGSATLAWKQRKD